MTESHDMRPRTRLERSRPLARPAGPTALAISLTLTACLAATAATAEYAIIDLGTIDGGATAAPGSIARGFAPGGLIVGESVRGDLDGLLHAFRWDAGSGMTGLEPPAAYRHSVAIGGLADGRVVGNAFNLGTGRVRAVRWTGTLVEELGSFEVVDVGADGTLVGGTTEGSEALHRRPVRWTVAGIQDLPTLGGPDGVAQAIAPDGSIAGTSGLAGSAATRAVLWQGGSVVDLGTLGGPSSRGHAVATGGRAAGDADLPGGIFHACRFTVGPGGTVTREDLGAIGTGTSSARAMNEAGLVVGTSASRAVRWAGAGIEDLNALIPPGTTWQLVVAHDVDDDGRITGFGVHEGQPRAFLLQPRDSADVNGDGTVGLADLLIVLAQWGPCGDCPADVDGDGVVGFGDVLAILAAWDF